MCARCVSPCGKLPSSSPVRGSISSENSPRSLAAGDRLVEHRPRLARASPARARHSASQNEQHRNAPSSPWQPVVAPVAIEQPVAGVELLADRRDRPQHPLVVPVDVLDRRQQQQRRVELRCGRTPARRRRACGRSRARSIVSRSSSRTCFQRRVGARRMHSSASRIPRSSADQHSTFECTKCSGSPGHSQMPQSGSAQCSRGVIDQRDQKAPVVVARASGRGGASARSG